MSDEILKDFIVPQPRTQNSWNDQTSPRRFTVEEFEAACWQARAAGAVDSTEVEIHYREGLKFLALPAFVVEIPPALRQPAVRYEEPPDPRPVHVSWLSRMPRWQLAAAVALGPIVVPTFLFVVAFVWGQTVGRLW